VRELGVSAIALAEKLGLSQLRGKKIAKEKGSEVWEK